jgi:hypothetical protein
MARFAIPTLVYEGDYGPALVIRSRLEAAGITVSFNGLPVGGSGSQPHESRLYVAREDVAEARRVIESRRL